MGTMSHRIGLVSSIFISRCLRRVINDSTAPHLPHIIITNFQWEFFTLLYFSHFFQKILFCKNAKELASTGETSRKINISSNRYKFAKWEWDFLTLFREHYRNNEFSSIGRREARVIHVQFPPVRSIMVAARLQWLREIPRIACLWIEPGAQSHASKRISPSVGHS